MLQSLRDVRPARIREAAHGNAEADEGLVFAESCSEGLGAGAKHLIPRQLQILHVQAA